MISNDTEFNLDNLLADTDSSALLDLSEDFARPPTHPTPSNFNPNFPLNNEYQQRFIDNTSLQPNLPKDKTYYDNLLAQDPLHLLDGSFTSSFQPNNLSTSSLG